MKHVRRFAIGAAFMIPGVILAFIGNAILSIPGVGATVEAIVSAVAWYALLYVLPIGGFMYFIGWCLDGGFYEFATREAERDKDR